MTGFGTGRLAVGIVLVTLVAALIGYVIASAVLTFRAMPTAPRGAGLTKKDFEARKGIGERG